MKNHPWRRSIVAHLQQEFPEVPNSTEVPSPAQSARVRASGKGWAERRAGLPYGARPLTADDEL